VTVDELPAMFEGIAAKVLDAAKPAVDAMADTFQDYVVRELNRFQVSIGAFGTPSPAHIGPPAHRSGKLAGSVTVSPGASGGGVATASVAPHTIYARTQEVGEIHRAKRLYMHWINDGGEWWRKMVDIPERPYMRPAHDATIADGSLTRAAMEAFVRATGL